MSKKTRYLGINIQFISTRYVEIIHTSGYIQKMRILYVLSMVPGTLVPWLFYHIYIFSYSITSCRIAILQPLLNIPVRGNELPDKKM
jgi:hypothetical protein